MDFKPVAPPPLGVASHAGHSELCVFYAIQLFVSFLKLKTINPFLALDLHYKLPWNPKYTQNVEEVTRKFPVLAKPECFSLILVTLVKCRMQDSKWRIKWTKWKIETYPEILRTIECSSLNIFEYNVLIIRIYKSSIPCPEALLFDATTLRPNPIPNAVAPTLQWHLKGCEQCRELPVHPATRLILVIRPESRRGLHICWPPYMPTSQRTRRLRAYKEPCFNHHSSG